MKRYNLMKSYKNNDQRNRKYVYNYVVVVETGNKIYKVLGNLQ